MSGQRERSKSECIIEVMLIAAQLHGFDVLDPLFMSLFQYIWDAAAEEFWNRGYDAARKQFKPVEG